MMMGGIRDEEAVEELWVSTDDEAVHLWLVVRAIEPDVERRLYGVEDVLYGRFPEAAFQVHVLNPRYYAGEMLYVNPNRPVTRGCFVAVEMDDGQGLIKQFVRRNDNHLVLAQFNPPKELRLPVAQVKRIYRITGSGEPG